MLPFHNSSCPPDAELEASVIIPCKNEADHLASTLSALREQQDLTGRPLANSRWEILLLVNNSTDDSFAIAQHFKNSHPHLSLHIAQCTLPSDRAHIGYVRKQLMDTACARLLLRRKPLSLILSTDADTTVAPDWLAQNWQEAERGAGAIGGRISLLPADIDALDDRTKHIQRCDDRYRLLISWLEDVCDPQPHDRWPRHHQHFTGSLAVRPEIYQQVGGLPPREYLEDVAFYEALICQDVAFRHSPAVRVHTSARLDGRTPVGLAEQLSRWKNSPSPILVPSVHLMRTVFSLRHRVRILWNHAQEEDAAAVQTLAAACLTPLEELRDALRHRWFGAAWEFLGVQTKLERQLPDGMRQQPLDAAVEELEEQFRANCDLS